MKILIVEDEQVLARVIEEKLNRAGYFIEIATDGDAGIAAARISKPDGIVLDLSLPKKDGLEVLEAIKQDDELKSIPVIVVTNRMLDTDIKRALALGAADYFVKSEHPLNAIIDKIEKIVPQS